MDEITDLLKEIRKGVIAIKRGYDTIPVEMTNLKLACVAPFSYSQRLMALSGLSVLASFVFLRTSSGALPFMRNSFLAFWGAGLFVMPEIYNPLFRK